MPDQQSAPTPPKFDPAAAQQRRPKVRSLRGFPVEVQNPQGQKATMLGLSDSRQISEKMVVTSPAAQHVIPLLDGSRELSDIVSQVGRGLTLDILQQLIAQLDDAALLEGPVFDALLAKSRAEFDASDTLPPASTAAFADSLVTQAFGAESAPSEESKAQQGPALLRGIFDQWMSQSLAQVDKPSFDELPRAIVTPHLDYGRGWLNYANVYGRLRVCDRPDRVIILGTNHFGVGTGVVGCNKGYESPLGVCDVDQAVASGLRARLGDAFFENRFDHEREHSIEVQIPWVQHIFGKDNSGRFLPVFGATVHDPCVNNGESYDGKGIALDPFVAAVKSVVAELPGKTLFISSADLSHVGPAFGDQSPMIGDTPEVEQNRNKVVQHDVQMLDMVVKNKPQELIAAMSWQQNPTRWCSIGNLAATLMIVEPAKVELLNYAAAIDQQGTTMVSSAALAMR